MIKKIIIITLFVIVSAGVAGAIPSGSDYDWGRDHTGRYCSACHTIGACDTNCHPRDGGEPGYMGRHIKPAVCSRCHGEKVNNPDIHAVHGKKICSNCHSAAGYNSTIAKVPPSGSSDSMVIPKSNDCNYCHGFFGNRRLHGIHKPFLVEENCPKCHGQINFQKEEILRITGKEPAASGTLAIALKPEVKEVVMAPINILTNLFNSIAGMWMRIFSYLS